MHNTELFKQDMRNNGIEPPSTISPGGKKHRFRVNDDKSGSRNGWYKFYGDAGSYGCYKRGIVQKWSCKNRQTMTTAEIEEKKRQHVDEQECHHSECRKKAISIWKRATKEGIADHPYSVHKEIKPLNVRIGKNDNLIIPIHDMDKKLHGLQFIKPDGDKKFMAGAAMKGNFFLLGKEPEEANALIICEGWATGCSLRQATKLPVVVAFNAGNLKPVAEVWRAELPEMKIVIAGDDDHATDGNPGKTKAIEAARAVNGITVFPEFEDAAENTDFNDMHQEQGLDEVKKLVLEACSKDPEDFDDDTWPEPILFGAFDTPKITSNLLPEPLAGFSKAVTNFTQTPSGLPVMMALATASTCLQKLFEVSPYGDNYREPVNIMSVVALDPATRKTAVKNAMTEPLTSWEMEQADALKEPAAKVHHEREIITKSIESIKSSVSKANSTDEERQDALAEIKRLEDSMPDEIIMPQLWTDDVTPERLQNLMLENGERMAVLSDEGGVFEVFAGLYSGGNSNINVVLQSHAGSPVRVQRQGRSVKMNKPALTFGLTVQPDIVIKLASGNKSGFRGNGFLARLLYCIPKSTVGSRDVTKRSPIPESIRTKYHNKIKRLLSIKPKFDEFGNEKPRILTLDSEALKSWQEFSQYVESKQGKYGEFHSIQDWTGKLPGAALRIAGLCHVVEYGSKSTCIDNVTIERAIKLANLLIPHAKAAFGMMGGDPAVNDAKEVLHWIVVKNGCDTFLRSNLQKALHGRFPRIDRLKSALKVLQERHIISDEKQRYTGRRPEITYDVNPSILKGGKG
jgi:putative DNA primase/helicase